MSNKSNDYGRAFEFACITDMYEKVSSEREIRIETDDSYQRTLEAWERIDRYAKANLKKAASSATNIILDLEPQILERDNDEVILKIQKDSRGIEGDVRDMLIIRDSIDWEIGLSIKHNNFAAKHSRLSRSLDFGNKWYGVNCSDDYWGDINDIFSYLESEKKKGSKWSDLSDKEEKVYIPLLSAFINEIQRACNTDKTIPGKMVEYILGKFDFYKVVGQDREEETIIMTYNFHGTLGQSSEDKESVTDIPIVELPTSILHIGFDPEHTNNTVIMSMNNGWQFSFRIHNASTVVETSLKFDVQIIGSPTSIVQIKKGWE